MSVMNLMDGYNATKLNEENVYESIKLYLDKKKNKNTRASYEKNFNKFFLATRSKTYEHITKSDLARYTLEEMEYFQKQLNEEMSNGSVNQVMSSIYSLMQKLASYGYIENLHIFKVSRLPTDSKGYGVLEDSEIKQMIELVGGIKTERGMLIHLGYVTALRKEALLSLEASNFKREKGLSIVEAKDKNGKISKTALAKETVEAIEYLLEKSSDSKLFHLSSATVTRMMTKLVNELGLEGRNITFHSIRKASCNEAIAMTGDVKEVQAHMGHSSASTTMDAYAKAKEISTIGMEIGKEVDMSIFEAMSKKELIKMIARADRDTQLKLLRYV